MNFKPLAFLLIRILSIYTILQGIIFFFQFMQTVILNPLGESLGFTIALYNSGSAAALLLIGFLLWFKTDRLASLVLRDLDTSSASYEPAEKNALYQVGISLTGLIIAVLTIPALIGHFFTIIHHYSTDNYEYISSASLWINLLVAVVKLLLAGVLLLRVYSVNHLLYKLRMIGLKDQT